MAVEVAWPDECMGDVIGDLNSRRGKVLGMDTKGHGQVIKAPVPMSEILKYAPDLRSMTSGRGSFEAQFSHYEEAPPPIAEKDHQGDERGARGRRRKIARARPRIAGEQGRAARYCQGRRLVQSVAGSTLRWRRLGKSLVFAGIAIAVVGLRCGDSRRCR